jgi:peptidoglycan/LPS O-acetylase OafA/YrhL
MPLLATGRIRNLDVLRGAAVVLVLGRHMGIAPLDAPVWLQSIMDLWIRAGWAGVDLFFVLSGFLVSGLLFREYQRSGRVDTLRFLARRGLRIYPAFYAFLVATSVASGTIFTRRFAAEALFVQNYVPGLWDHTWSLAVEEHFYLLLAAVVFLAVRWRSRAPVTSSVALDPFARLPAACAVVALVALTARVLTALYGSPYFSHHLYPTHLRLDSLLFGVLLSYLVTTRGEAMTAWVNARRTLLVLGALLCLAPTLFWPLTALGMETVGFTLTYLGFGALLLLALVARPASGPDSVSPGAASGPLRLARAIRRRLASLLAWIGVYSYSIYLWHLAAKRWGVPPVLRLFHWQPDTVAAFVVYTTTALIIGAAMARLVELPSLALRARWIPEGQPNQQPLAVSGQPLATPSADSRLSTVSG